MLYRVANDGQSVTVALEGQLNFASNDAFCSLLGELSGLDNRRVTFDLSALSYIDSVGLGCSTSPRANWTPLAPP